ncbi:MAG: OstA-like protein, partial [Pseudomonadota bacterium]
MALSLASNLLAKDKFEFSLGEQIHVLSDKAYRLGQNNYFEAIGNVVITHNQDAIYGEKASFSQDTGDVKVVGNVRYIGTDMTLYGSELDYNYLSQQMTAKNARILTQNYVIVGKKLTRFGRDLFIGEDAEYSTCRDCPESWSVFGHNVRIILNEYIHIQHAYIKMKGVVIFYTPYMVIPIKRDRQTGLLFPKFGMNWEKGVTFQQPWFWAMGRSNDMTLTPSVWGKRGMGNEWQYRHVLGENKWFEINSLQAWDEIYQVNKRNNEPSGHHYFRNYVQY